MSDQQKQSVLEKDGLFSEPKILRDIVIVAAPIIVLGFIGNLIGLSTVTGGLVINLGYLISIIVGAFILKQQGSNWLDIGLGKPSSWWKTTLAGVGALITAVTVFMATQVIVLNLLTMIGLSPAELDQSRFNSMVGNLPLFILLVIAAWTTIAFGEELFYRAFLISRMLDYTGVGQWSAIFIAGSIFGVAHFAEGFVGILSNTAFGILFGWFYVRSGRNLWITIIGHGLINTLRFALLYAGLA